MVESSGSLHLSKSHTYFYQVQTEMYVTSTQWCDFVVWSPNEDPFVERINYDSIFIEKALVKLKNFLLTNFCL